METYQFSRSSSGGNLALRDVLATSHVCRPHGRSREAAARNQANNKREVRRRLWVPQRMLRDGIIDSRRVNRLSEPAEILYRRLMSVVDDYGRFECDLDVIRARCFPLQLDRWPISKIDACLEEISPVDYRESPGETVDHCEPPLITVYSVGRKKYIQINNFGQRVQSKPKYPEPPEPFSTVNHGDPPLRARERENERTTSNTKERNTSLEELQEISKAFDRHLKHDPKEPRDLVIQQVISMNGKLDWEKFHKNHAPYCEHYENHGWDYSKLSFWAWINAGCPPPPMQRKTVDSEKPKQTICPNCNKKPCVCFEQRIAKHGVPGLAGAKAV